MFMKDGDIKIVGLSSNKQKGKTNWKVLGAIIGIFVLTIGVIAGIILVRQQQNISEKASEIMCSDPLAEQCPGIDGILRNCHPPENGGGAKESACNSAGRVEFCGTKCFICPSVNGTWTPTDLSKCSTAPTPTPTTAPTVAPTPTPQPVSCLPMVYFNTVLTDANGDNAGSCKTTTLMFGQNGASCGTNTLTCDQYLTQLSTDTGVTKVQGGCFVDTAACEKPDGKVVSFRFFYDTVKKSCISTNHRYDSKDIDVDDVNHKTCVESLTQYGGASVKKVCYTTKPACLTANAVASPTATSTTQTATPTATSSAGQPNSCGGTCGSNTNCASGLFCYIQSGATSGFCRNSTCSTDTDCNCTGGGATATSTSKPKSTATAVPLPVTGTEWPTMLGVGFGIVMLLVSMVLAL